MKKRVLCLYRVSTEQQVNAEDDIPVQRRECMDFINRMPDWEFIGEKLEKGVSGFKVSTSKRDAIQEIRQMAERNEFDILLVFMFDRLGRREDETPFLVEWFVNHGIEVWSTREGQQRNDNRGDKLMNYIRYWMAGGESEKTSLRVKAAHTQMTEDGVWRGGKVLDENATAVRETESQLRECQDEKDTEESRIQNMYEQFSRISAWKDEFDTADVETKKMILARIIEKITIEKGYKIHIHFYLTREELLKELQPREVEITEANTWYLTGT